MKHPTAKGRRATKREDLTIVTFSGVSTQQVGKQPLCDHQRKSSVQVPLVRVATFVVVMTKQMTHLWW